MTPPSEGDAVKREAGRWPFARSPGEVAADVYASLAHFNGDMIAALREVFIEKGEPLKRGWKVGNEFAPYHPIASQVPPDYRDGWNACFEMAPILPVSAQTPAGEALLRKMREAAQRLDAPSGCTCEACEPHALRMILCARCGNKRCPHATNHRNACTNSNEPGQPGSSYGPPAQPSKVVAALESILRCAESEHCPDARARAFVVCTARAALAELGDRS